MPKKGDLLNCNNYRLISLVSHIKRFIACNKDKNQEENSSWQFSFKENKGTRNATFVMRMTTGRCIEKHELYITFINYEKAIDRVKHEEIM